jgi:pSer/pThr/pTyr-binding forkhead associated (FHA) protein
MDVVQLTTHIDATAVRVATATQDSYATRESRDSVAAQVRANTSRPAVLILFDGGEHTVIDLTEGSHRIGRSITADIQLEDPLISRKHAMIERAGTAVRVLDDRSLNGVFVNRERVNGSHPLTDNDEVTIGDFVLRLLLTD